MTEPQGARRTPGAMVRCPHPGASAPAAVPTHANRIPPVTVSSTQRILLVEDDTAIRELTQDVLSESGYEITAVGDAETAVDALATADSFDLLISDIRLPGMNGCELARHAMTQDPALRVLLVTGYSGLRAGDPQFVPRDIPLLRKPFTLQELLQSVHSTI